MTDTCDTSDTCDTTDTFTSDETALVIMARYPELGKTKTRLARSIGDEQTLYLYTAFLADLAQRFAGLKYALHWAHTPADIDYLAFAATLAPEHTHHMWSFAQQGPSLGVRLHHAFQQTYQHGYQRTILIGSDSPHISHAIVETAYMALDDADVVLDPADDGGVHQECGSPARSVEVQGGMRWPRPPFDGFYARWVTRCEPIRRTLRDHRILTAMGNLSTSTQRARSLSSAETRPSRWTARRRSCWASSRTSITIHCRLYGTSYLFARITPISHVPCSQAFFQQESVISKRDKGRDYLR